MFFFCSPPTPGSYTWSTSGFPTKTCMRFSSASFLSHGRLYNSPLFDHPDINWCWVKNHQVSHCALVSSRLLPSALLVPSSFLSTLFSNIFSLCFSLTWETKFHTRTKWPAIVLCILRVIRTFLGVTKGPRTHNVTWYAPDVSDFQFTVHQP